MLKTNALYQASLLRYFIQVTINRIAFYDYVFDYAVGSHRSCACFMKTPNGLSQDA